MTQPNFPNLEQKRLPKWLIWVGVAYALCLLILWITTAWEWSTIDDAGYAVRSLSNNGEFGIVGGVFHTLIDELHGAGDSGLFKPSQWVYDSTVYLATPSLVASLRLTMLFLATMGPVYYCARKGIRGTALGFTMLVMLIGSSGLIVGVSFMSLQELSGAAFIGLGLAINRRGVRIACWLIAAWFKAPFAWLLIGYSIPLWRAGRKKWAVLAALLGIGTIATAGVLGRNGSYTARFYRTTTGLIIDAVTNNGPLLLSTAVILLVASAAYWFLVTWTPIRLTWESIAFLVGLFGYAVNLLPWTISGYYGGAVLYLLALVILSLVTNEGTDRSARKLLALSIPTLVAFTLVVTAIRDVRVYTHSISTARNCLLQLPNNATVSLDGNLTYVATPEGAVRFGELLSLAETDWEGSIRYRDDSAEFLLLATRAEEFESLAPDAEQLCRGLGVATFRVRA